MDEKQVIDYLKKKLSKEYDKGFVDYFFSGLTLERLQKISEDDVKHYLDEYCWKKANTEEKIPIRDFEDLVSYTDKVLDAVSEGMTTTGEVINYALKETVKEKIGVDPESFWESLGESLEELELENEYSPEP